MVDSIPENGHSIEDALQTIVVHLLASGSCTYLFAEPCGFSYLCDNFVSLRFPRNFG